MSRLILLRDLEPGRLYKVSARSIANGAGSEWSQMIDVQTVSDTVAPKPPTAISWTTSGTSFKGTWTAPTQNEDNTALNDFKDYQVTLYSSAAPATKVVYYTTATRYDFTFEANLAAFGTPRASVTIEIRSRDNTGNLSATALSATASNPAPATPANVSANGVTDGVSIKWDSVSDSDLKEYRIYYGTSLAGATTLVWSGVSTSAIHRNTAYSTDAYYKVVSVDVFGTESVAAGVGPVRPVSPFAVDTVAPPVPAGLAATLTNATDGKTASAAVSWTAVADTDNDLSSYIVGYKPSATTDWQYTTVDYTNTSTTITGLLPYTNYDFRIRSSDWAANLSAWSSVVTKTATANGAPAVPTGLSITPGRDNVIVKWTANTEPDMANGAGVYDVTISTSSTFASGNLQYRTGADSIAVNGLNTNTTYYARVRATDSGGVSSAYSASVNATTGTFPVTPLSDGIAPASSPTPTATGGVGYIFASWTPISNADLVTYEVHLGTSQAFNVSATSKVGEVAGSTIIIKKDGAGADLAYGTTYYVKTVAKDRDGSASISGYSNAVSMVKATSTDIGATPRQLGVPTITTAATAPVSPINGDVWNDTTTGLEKQWNGSGWVATGNVSDKYIASRGTDLVTNGTAILGSNYNFTGFDYDGTDAPTGANGSFVAKNTAYASTVAGEFLSFDPSKQYKFSFQARQTIAGAQGRIYGFFAPYDAYNLSIQPQYYMYVANTTTTLAAPLNPGDTTVTLTSAANWYGSASKPAGTSTHLRGIIFWDYIDAGGKAWPTGSYSRNAYLNLWADGGISGNVITLSSAWTGPAKPAGTPLSNSTAGGTYMYMPSASYTLVPETWTPYSDIFSAGIMSPSAQAVAGGGAATWAGGMPPGTAKFLIGWLLNAPSPGTGKHAIAGVSVSDASAAQSAANSAMATANGKNKIIRDTVDANGTAGYVAGDLWWKLDGSGNVTQQWKFTGTSWVTEKLDDGVFNSISANKLAANSAFVVTLNVGAGGAIQSAGYTSGGTSGFQLSSSGLVIKGSGNTVDGGTIPANTIDVNSIKTSTLTATTITIGAGGIIQTATGGVQITNSGIVIPAGMLDANVLKGNTAFVTTLNIGAGGVIQSTGYTSGGTSGFQLSQTGLTIKGANNTVDGGTIPTSTLDVNAIKTSTLSTTTISLGTNGVISVGVGGTISIDGSTGQLKSNNYAANSTGYRLSNAGLEINDGSVDAKVLKTGTAIIGDLTIGRSADALGTIKSFDYVAGSAGWKIGKGLFEINQGTVRAAALQIQDSDNIMPAQFADFEFVPSYYTVGTSSAMYSASAPTSVNILTASPKFNKQYLSASWAGAVAYDPYIYFAPTVTTYNIPVEAGETYIVSAYARATGSVATNLILAGRLSNGTAFSAISTTLPASNSTWTRYSAPVTIPAGVTAINTYVQSTTRTAGAGFEIDGIQVERKVAGLNTPSLWTPPGSTSIDAGIIRTGQLQSTSTVTVNGTSQPAWSINMSGNAQFGSALVRGNLIVGAANTNIAPGGGTFESNITGYTVYAGSGSTSATLARTTTSPLSGTASALANSTSSTNAQFGLSFALSTPIPAGVGFTLRALFQPDNDSGLFVALNDGTTSFLYDLASKTVKANTTYQLSKTYVPTSPVSRIYIYSSGTTAKNLRFDNIEVLVDPDLGNSYAQSGNFVSGISGWKIDSSGVFEVNNGVFRGTIDSAAITGASYQTSTGTGAVVIDEYLVGGGYNAGVQSTFSQGRITLNDADPRHTIYAHPYISPENGNINSTARLTIAGPQPRSNAVTSKIFLDGDDNGTTPATIWLSTSMVTLDNSNGKSEIPLITKGSVSIPIVSNGGTTNITVTFPNNMVFNSAPNVFVNAESTRLNAVAVSRTSNGFTFQVSNWSGANSSACAGTWVAVL